MRALVALRMVWMAVWICWQRGARGNHWREEAAGGIARPSPYRVCEREELSFSLREYTLSCSVHMQCTPGLGVFQNSDVSRRGIMKLT
jgi:hypothetical protein